MHLCRKREEADESWSGGGRVGVGEGG